MKSTLNENEKCKFDHKNAITVMKNVYIVIKYDIIKCYIYP